MYPELGIPRSTAATWLIRDCPEVVTLEPDDDDAVALTEQLQRVEKIVRRLVAVIRLQRALLCVFGISLEKTRLPDGGAKALVLRAVARARAALPLGVALRILELSPARFHAWTRADNAECGLDDRSSCPRTSPSQLTPEETMTIKEMVTSNEYRHMPLKTLARFAQRVGRVFASPSTWGKLVRARGWRRPRLRVYPAKPKVGIRATRPNEYIHIDVTVIRLITGVKLYLHGVIDNFSRRILAWRLAERLDPLTTCEVLADAGREMFGEVPIVVADSGVENVNGAVDALVDAGLIRRVLALAEVSYSNSMIEAWWRSLRHNWLYLYQLDDIEAVRKLVEFYVHNHNAVMPHSAFRGQTPDEIYCGTGGNVTAELEAAAKVARQRRLTANRAARCHRCVPEDGLPPPSTAGEESLRFP